MAYVTQKRPTEGTAGGMKRTATNHARPIIGIGRSNKSEAWYMEPIMYPPAAADSIASRNILLQW